MWDGRKTPTGLDTRSSPKGFDSASDVPSIDFVISWSLCSILTFDNPVALSRTRSYQEPARKIACAFGSPLSF